MLPDIDSTCSYYGCNDSEMITNITNIVEKLSNISNIIYGTNITRNLTFTTELIEFTTQNNK